MLESRLGLIGLGVIGQHFLKHLQAGASQITVYDIDPIKVKEAERGGAQGASSPSEVGQASDIVILSLPNPPAVDAVILGDQGLLEGATPGDLIIDVSTVDPRTNREMYSRAADVGVSYVDAPISGAAPGEAGMYGAEAGTVTFMIGGDEDAYQRALPVLELLGQDFFHLGPSGSGTTVKLISNLASGIYILVTAEAFALGAAAGVKAERLMEVFTKTDAKSYIMSDYLIPRLLRQEFNPGFTIKLQLKDHRLAGELGNDLGVPLYLNGLATQLYRMFIAMGRGDLDITESIRAMAEIAGTDLYDPPQR